MVRKMHPAEKVHAGGNGFYEDLARMQGQFQSLTQKPLQKQKQAPQFRLVMRENDKIIRIADVVRNFEFVLHELVKLVHVDVHEKLGGEVTERQSFSGNSRIETPHNLPKETKNVAIRNSFADERKENTVVNARKEFSDIALQDKAGSRVIFARLVRKRTKAIHRAVRTFPQTARKGIRNEFSIKEWVQNAVNRVGYTLASAKTLHIAF